jgi:dTDP-4-amino-4,6-dideoxygalactose transaminase
LKIPLSRPDITEDDLAAMAVAMRSGQLVQAEQVSTFEKSVGEFSDGGEVVAVSNCTAALQLSLLALGIGKGDRVGVATYSWPATANAIVLSGAIPVFIDIEPLTLGMDPEQLERTLTREAGLKAIMPVHAFGNMADMPAITMLGERSLVPIIEDSACALGARLDGRAAGSWGRVGCFSFHPRKAATTGEGGAIRTGDPEIATTLRSLRNHGQDFTSGRPEFVRAGFNMRLTEFQAALGTSQLSRYTATLERRRACANRYDEMLRDLPLETPTSRNHGSHVYQSYVVCLPKEIAGERNRIIEALKARGIETNFGTHHMPLLRFYRDLLGHERGHFPVTDAISESAIALPFFAQILSSQQEAVAEALKEAISAIRLRA